MYETPSTQPPRRDTLLVALEPSEQERAVAELQAAGFAVVEARTPADLAAVSTSAESIALAIIDVSQQPDPTLAAIKELRRHRGEFPTLFVATSESFGALDEAAIGATDEIALRPVTADSLRWRVEAMVVRSSAD